LSSNSDEDDSLIKREKVNKEEDNDEIDADKLDFEYHDLLARVNALKEFLPKYQMQSQ
jgi:hypothetical protein